MLNHCCGESMDGQFMILSHVKTITGTKQSHDTFNSAFKQYTFYS